MKSIAIVGSGNVGWHMAKELFNANFKICNCYSRNIDRAKELAIEVNSRPINKISEIKNKCDVILVAIHDDATDEIIKLLDQQFQGKIICHTSGAKPMVNNLQNNESGVFYPLQTFSRKGKVEFSNVPILIEGENKEVQNVLTEIASNISSNVQLINSKQREQIHLAAVFACNFTNHFYQIANDLLASKNMSFDLLLPLISETVNKVKSTSPEDAQTGPAKRNDQKTMQKHLNLLQGNDNLQTLYKLISAEIQNKSNHA